MIAFSKRVKMNKLKKSQNDKMIFGVCGGLSEYSGINSALIRLGFILGSIFTGSILLWLYILLAILLPKT
jgi:phage shock protein PspC (stress-responsive transcriptional regulator)